MKYLLLAILLSGCCTLRYPLDGKAQSSCERKKRAEKLCNDHDGLKQYGYGFAICEDGFRPGPDSIK